MRRSEPRSTRRSRNSSSSSSTPSSAPTRKKGKRFGSPLQPDGIPDSEDRPRGDQREPWRLRDRAARPRLRLHVRQLAAPRAALVARGRRRHLGEARGRAHEFTTLPGVREDVTDIILNLKNLVAILHGDSPEIEVRLSKKGAGVVKASRHRGARRTRDPEPGSRDREPVRSKGRLEITLTIGRGRGYVPSENNRGPEHTIGVIPIDSIFSPVRRVSYDVEAARVGQRTDYDKLRLDVTTDGSVNPKDAIAEAAEILDPAARDLHRPREDRGLRRGRGRRGCRRRAVARARDGELPDRGARARRALVQLPEARRDRDDRRPRHEDGGRARRDPELRRKSIEEVKETLATHGLNLRGDEG